jgi:hypothetical protein
MIIDWKSGLVLTRLMELIAKFLSTDPNTTNQFDIGYDALMLDTMWYVLGISRQSACYPAVQNFNDDQIIPLGIN